MEKIRLTGGEPLVRREVERLVEMLARIPRLGELAMTTNGSALARKARAPGDAGLRRITVSLDSLDNEVFAAVNDFGFPVERVLAGIEAAAAAEIVAMIGAEMPFETVAPNYSGEVVERWRYGDGSGEIGVMASVTRPFSGGCTRAGLSAEGKLFNCLFAGRRPRLARAAARGCLRRGDLRGDRRDLVDAEDRYSGLRKAATAGLPKVEMSYIVG